MRKLLVLTVILMLGLVPQAQAFFINFETGTNGSSITDITGVSFEDFNGYSSIYGDTRTGAYNTHSDDLNYGWGDYHHNGNMWLWAGESADARGVKVDFTNNDGTWFRTGYSSTSAFYLDAFLTDGSSISVVGGSNYGSDMAFLQIDILSGQMIDYVVVHDTGNYWIVDDMSGDATGVPDQQRVPEPGTLMLLGSGLFGLVGYRRAKRMM